MENQIPENNCFENDGKYPGTDSRPVSDGEAKDDLIIGLLKKQLVAQRIIMGVMAAMLVAFIVFGMILVPKLITTIESVDETLAMVDDTIVRVNEEVIPLITELDMDNVNKAVATMEQAVREFDVEGLNEAVEQLKTAVEKFDIEALNTAIDSLNTTIKPLKSFVELFGKK